jgi:hypothetical protein
MGGTGIWKRARATSARSLGAPAARQSDGVLFNPYRHRKTNKATASKEETAAPGVFIHTTTSFCFSFLSLPLSLCCFPSDKKFSSHDASVGAVIIHRLSPLGGLIMIHSTFVLLSLSFLSFRCPLFFFIWLSCVCVGGCYIVIVCLGIVIVVVVAVAVALFGNWV